MRLARWNNTRGVSAGTWRIEGVPGLILLRQYIYGYWHFAFSPKSQTGEPRLYSGTPAEMMSTDSQTLYPLATRLMKGPLSGRRFPTRAQAMLALEAIVSEERSELASLIS